MEAIARKVVEIVDARSTTFGLVDARELAEELGVSIDYVYAHATELGAMRLGSGQRPASASTLIERARRSKSAGQQANEKGRRRAGVCELGLAHLVPRPRGTCP